jgi:hypothetical protein
MRAPPDTGTVVIPAPVASASAQSNRIWPRSAWDSTAADPHRPWGLQEEQQELTPTTQIKPQITRSQSLIFHYALSMWAADMGKILSV